MANLKNITTNEELNNFINNDGLNVLKCSATWCGPCRVLSVNIQSLDENKFNKPTNFAELDISENEWAENFVNDNKIRGIPVLIFYKNGVEIFRHVGLLTVESLYEKVNELC